MREFEIKKGRDYGKRLWMMFDMPFGKWMGVALVLFFIFDEFRNPDRFFEAFMFFGFLIGMRHFVREAHKNSDDTSIPIGLYARKQLLPDVCYHLGVHVAARKKYLEQHLLIAVPRWIDCASVVSRYTWLIYKG